MKTAVISEVTIYLFANDLRVSDNHALQAAINDTQNKNTSLLCMYCLVPHLFNRVGDQAKSMGAARWQFLLASIADLKSQLHDKQMALTVSTMNWVDALDAVANECTIKSIHLGATAGYYERQAIDAISRKYNVTTHDNQTLYDQADLPMALDDLPKHFTPFRKRLEKVGLPNVLKQPDTWPKSHQASIDQWSVLTANKVAEVHSFDGGETAGLAHLEQYMQSDLPSHYKKVRNELMGWSNSTKFSPWLAWGCLSPRQIMQQLHQYEVDRGANESTYWIFFELLWREFFHWNGLKQGSRLFHTKGSDVGASSAPELCQKFIDWSEGNTGVPLIDACMRQLNHSGYMSNRGRQIAASYLINEAGVDWRLGAAYFEQQLVDFDVASNWGNWQYIAGVGADPRGGRHFNIEKQQKTHDPKNKFINRWADFEVKTHSVQYHDVMN